MEEVLNSTQHSPELGGCSPLDSQRSEAVQHCKTSVKRRASGSSALTAPVSPMQRPARRQRTDIFHPATAHAQMYEETCSLSGQVTMWDQVLEFRQGVSGFQLAAIGDRPVRRCQTLVTSSLATGEIVGRARHSYRWRRRPDFMRLADAPGRERDTSRLYASAKRKKIGPRSFQLAAIGDRPVRRCQTLVTSSLATGEIVGRARHSYRWRRRPDFMRLADAPGREVCQTLVTSSLATGEIVGRARHSYRWRRRPDFMRLADAPGREPTPSTIAQRFSWMVTYAGSSGGVTAPGYAGKPKTNAALGFGLKSPPQSSSKEIRDRVPIPFDSTHTLPQHPCPSTAAAAVDTLFPPQDEPELAPPQTRTTYSKQKIATQEAWNNDRDDLFNLMKVTVNAAKIWTRN
ncbi:hypothetical protein Bbelb_303010 [Branchiostoma belcheri]|nr:hypothetical protein Bbelb_303010 [Branchiostoma belcheri]